MPSEALGLGLCVVYVSGPGAQQELHGHLGVVSLASPSSCHSVTLRSALGNLHSAGPPPCSQVVSAPISHPMLALSPLERFLPKAQPQSHHSPDSILPLSPSLSESVLTSQPRLLRLTLLRPMAPSAQSLSPTRCCYLSPTMPHLLPVSFFVPACSIPKAQEAAVESFPWGSFRELCSRAGAL